MQRNHENELKAIHDAQKSLLDRRTVSENSSREPCASKVDITEQLEAMKIDLLK